MPAEAEIIYQDLYVCLEVVLFLLSELLVHTHSLSLSHTHTHLEVVLFLLSELLV
jgi:hypothetical protein